MVLSNYFENLKIVVFIIFYLQLEKRQIFSLELGAFDTLERLLIAGFNDFKID